MIIHVLDKTLTLAGVIDDYISVIWRPAYYEVGDFELYIDASSEAVALLQEGYYLVRDTDIIVDDAGNVTYTKVMVNKGLKLDTDTENGDHLTYVGKELKYLLHQRIVWQQSTLTGTVENAIRKLVTDNAISPTDSNRVIPALILGAATGLTDTISKQVTGAHLDEAIKDICTAYNYGWEVYIYNSALVFIIYAGTDKSYSQTDRPYVVFNDDFDNILNSTYERNTDNYANCALVGGEGEGTARTYTTLNNSVSGLDRFETFVDARDVSQNVGTEDEIDQNTYISLLQERGLEKLAELAITEGFSGEVLTDMTFKYGEDFYLGDVVTVTNKYGISKDVRVLSAIESVDDSGTKLIPQFNM